MADADDGMHGRDELVPLVEAAHEAGVHPARFYHACIRTGHARDLTKFGTATALPRWVAEVVTADLQRLKGATHATG